MRALIIDWMDGRHLEFETLEEAEREYNEMIADKSIELDVSLYTKEQSYTNIEPQ